MKTQTEKAATGPKKMPESSSEKFLEFICAKLSQTSFGNVSLT